MFSYHMVLVYVFPLIVAVQYKEKSVLWLSYALEVFLMPVSMIVGFYYGICDLNLLLQGNHTRTWYLAELVDGFSKIPFAKMPVVVIVVYRILPQLLILLVFVMIIQHTIGSMREDAYRIAELTYRKEVDSATRLYNKNKYEDMLANYYTRVERVAVVLWDINNLKEINDRMGHGMGDKLIETMSGAIYAHYITTLVPTYFNFSKSSEFLAIVILGGSGSLTGSIVAAPILSALPQLISYVVPAFASYRMLIYAIILVVVMIFKPTGLFGGREFSLPKLIDKITKKKTPKEKR